MYFLPPKYNDKYIEIYTLVTIYKYILKYIYLLRVLCLCVYLHTPSGIR